LQRNAFCRDPIAGLSAQHGRAVERFARRGLHDCGYEERAKNQKVKCPALSSIAIRQRQMPKRKEYLGKSLYGL
jgi:hypothetical protein